MRDNRNRPTLIPEFDPQAFARDSETRQRASAIAVDEGQGLVDRARQLHDGGDHEQALFLVGPLLELEPHHPGAARPSMECRAALERECLGAVGSEATVLLLAVTIDELKACALDQVSGFLLSLADGSLRIREHRSYLQPVQLVERSACLVEESPHRAGEGREIALSGDRVRLQVGRVQLREVVQGRDVICGE